MDSGIPDFSRLLVNRFFERVGSTNDQRSISETLRIMSFGLCCPECYRFGSRPRTSFELETGTNLPTRTLTESLTSNPRVSTRISNPTRHIVATRGHLRLTDCLQWVPAVCGSHFQTRKYPRPGYPLATLPTSNSDASAHYSDCYGDASLMVYRFIQDSPKRNIETLRQLPLELR